MPAPALPRALLLTICGGLMLTGCGGGQQSSERPHRRPAASPSVSAADRACRDRWRTLAETYDPRSRSSLPSDLAERWASLVSTARLRAGEGTAQDCGDPLRSAQRSARLAEQLSSDLRRYDMERTARELQPSVDDWLRGHHSRDTVKRVRSAHDELTTQAPAATEDMKDGWGEAEQADLSRRKERRKVLADMRFLAGDSRPYRRASDAADTLRRLTAPTHGKSDQNSKNGKRNGKGR